MSLGAEGRALRSASAANLSKFFWEELICRYGAIGEVVTDNGPEVKGAFEELMRRYGIPQIRISAYNSKANGVVEREATLLFGKQSSSHVKEISINGPPKSIMPSLQTSAL